MLVATMMCNAAQTETALYDSALIAFGKNLAETDFLRLLKLLEGIGLVTRDTSTRTAQLTELGHQFAADLRSHSALH